MTVAPNDDKLIANNFYFDIGLRDLTKICRPFFKYLIGIIEFLAGGVVEVELLRTAALTSLTSVFHLPRNMADVVVEDLSMDCSVSDEIIPKSAQE